MIGMQVKQALLGRGGPDAKEAHEQALKGCESGAAGIDLGDWRK